ncbi:MAG: hypothetical protein QXS93_00080 [Candidatus Micrarchaeia archaeon]
MVTFKDDDFSGISMSLRKAIKDDLKRGATHTEIALKLLNDEETKIRINPKILTPDAVIAKFVADNPKLARENKEVLIEASKINYSIDNSNHKAFAIWALISSHLFYHEISGSGLKHARSAEEAELAIKELYEDLSKLLTGEDGKYMSVIAQFTDMMAQHTANVRELLNLEGQRIKEISSSPEKSLRLLHDAGYRVIFLKKGETIDPFVLHVAANPQNEKVFVIVKVHDGKVKVSLRAVNGKIGANLYRSLNEEEKSARGVKALELDMWNGSAVAGGSPIDGTKIPFDRLAVILSKHSC